MPCKSDSWPLGFNATLSAGVHHEVTQYSTLPLTVTFNCQVFAVTLVLSDFVHVQSFSSKSSSPLCHYVYHHFIMTGIYVYHHINDH